MEKYKVQDVKEWLTTLDRYDLAELETEIQQLRFHKNYPTYEKWLETVYSYLSNQNFHFSWYGNHKSQLEHGYKNNHDPYNVAKNFID